MIHENSRAAKAGMVGAVVGPVMEADPWKRLGACLDVIGENWDNGTHYGFVKADWNKLDRHLAKIETSAKKARRLLRPNIAVSGGGGADVH